MPEKITIAKISFFRRLSLARGRKKRNRARLKQLAEANLALKAPAAITGEMGLGQGDLAFLKTLARRPGLWQEYEFSKTPRPGNPAHLAGLALIYLSRFRRKVYLSDAGRFLLSLTAAVPDPKPRAPGPASQ